MTREIKFRGKTVPDGRWVYGYYVVMENETKTVTRHAIMDLLDKENQYIKDGKSYHMSVSVVEAETVGQFIGLYDRNGKEIYEGDIVYSEFEDGSNGSSLVGWNEKQSCFGLMDEYAYRSKLEGFEYPAFINHVMLAHMRDAKLFKVIGNIYDNPELLKDSSRYFNKRAEY